MPIMVGGARGLLHYPPLLSFSELNISNKTPLNKGWLKIEKVGTIPFTNFKLEEIESFGKESNMSKKAELNGSNRFLYIFDYIRYFIIEF